MILSLLLIFSCEDGTAKEQAEVDVVTNGIGNTARWEANVFKFVNKAQVHLHCAVRICINTDDNTCLLTNDEQDVCSNRRRRAADSYLPMQDETVRSLQTFWTFLSWTVFILNVFYPERFFILNVFILGSRCLNRSTYTWRRCSSDWWYPWILRRNGKRNCWRNYRGGISSTTRLLHLCPSRLLGHCCRSACRRSYAHLQTSPKSKSLFTCDFKQKVFKTIFKELNLEGDN